MCSTGESIAAQIDRSWSVINGFIGRLDLSPGLPIRRDENSSKFSILSIRTNEIVGFVWVSSRSMKKTDR